MLNSVESHREQFYQGIADAATHEWASRPRLMGFSYSEAGFTLAMQSWGDTIPWHVVATIANRCWMLAASGLPYLFDVAYTSPDGRIVVSITLRLAAEAIASVVDSNTAGSGPGSGSHPFGTIPAWAVDANGLPGDNLNQDWREGSVPSVNSEQAHYP